MFCKKCGFRLDDDANFCPKCGTTVSDDIKNRFSQQTNTAEKDNSYTYVLNNKDMFDFNIQLYNNYISGEQEMFDMLVNTIDSILKAATSEIIPEMEYKKFKSGLNHGFETITDLINCIIDAQHTLVRCLGSGSVLNNELNDLWAGYFECIDTIKNSFFSLFNRATYQVIDYDSAESFKIEYRAAIQKRAMLQNIASEKSGKLFSLILTDSFDALRYSVEQMKLAARLENQAPEV